MMIERNSSTNIISLTRNTVYYLIKKPSFKRVKLCALSENAIELSSTLWSCIKPDSLFKTHTKSSHIRGILSQRPKKIPGSCYHTSIAITLAPSLLHSCHWSISLYPSSYMASRCCSRGRWFSIAYCTALISGFDWPEYICSVSRDARASLFHPFIDCLFFSKIPECLMTWAAEYRYCARGKPSGRWIDTGFHRFLISIIFFCACWMCFHYWYFLELCMRWDRVQARSI